MFTLQVVVTSLGLCTLHEDGWLMELKQMSSTRSLHDTVLCMSSFCWHVYWCVLTGTAVLRDTLATVQGEREGKVI